MKDLIKKIPVSAQKVIGAVTPIVVVIILFVIVGKFGISKVVEVRAEIAKAQNDETVLTQKLTILQSVDATVATGSDISISALPDGNPSLIVVSQVKTLAASSGVILSNIKSGAGAKDPSGIFKADVSFDVIGARPQIITFLKGTANMAPLMVLSKIKIIESSGESRANVSVSSYWAELPKTLPALTDSLNDLTPGEKKILTDISTLTQPTFVQIPASSETSSGSTNPFGQ